MSKKPLMLCILDGFGWVPNKTEGNAIAAAKTPNLDKLFATCPYTTIGASGMDVGLPDGQMGNSEVGHTNIGAGRIVYQELTRITKAIQDGSIRSNEAIVNAMKAAIENGKAIHLMGLLSAGGVHSHIQHLFGLLDMAKDMGAKEIYVHAIMDGRDVPPDSGKGYIDELQAKLDELGVGKIASISGRYYAMDRDNRWDRVEKAYAAFVYGEGMKGTPAEVMANSYAEGVTDEFVVPAVTCEGGRVSEGDTVIFFNFRPDRAREITRTFVDDAFTGFERKNGRFAVNYVCFTQYDATMPNVDVTFKPQSLTNVMGEYLARQDPAAHRRNREVRPCDLLLQRRRGGSLRGRGSRPDRQPQGCHLRPAARDERLRGCRRVRQAHRERQVRRDHPELRQLRHGRPHRHLRGRCEGR